MNKTLQQQLVAARQASYSLLDVATAKKNAVLNRLAKTLENHQVKILRANQRDFDRLPKDYPLADRLRLTPDRIHSMASGLRAVAKLADPIGEQLDKRKMDSGITVRRVRVPIGVLGVIYEARPNVTIEIFSLCIKTGNAVVLKGGSDAYFTNTGLVQYIQSCLRAEGISPHVVQMINPLKRELTQELMQANGYVDMVIPRGGEGLIRFVRTHSTVPVVETGAGVCHVYVEKTADVRMAAAIVVNSKTRRPTLCNTLDTLVIDQAGLVNLAKAMASGLARYNVVIYADPPSYAALTELYPKKLLHRSTIKHYGKEYLSYAMSIKTVNAFSEGLAFIQKYTSGHSEGIITKNIKRAKVFLQKIDAAAVYHNTSIAFTDGFEFGLGAEIGISTQKMHARGPMGLEALTTYKWIVTSTGKIRTA